MLETPRPPLLLSLLLALAVVAQPRASAPPGCDIAGEWDDTNAHYWEQLSLRPDGTGTWIRGGMDEDAPTDHIDFQWSHIGNMLSVRRGDTIRTVFFALERHESSLGCTCWLMFDGPEHPFDRERVLLTILSRPCDDE